MNWLFKILGGGVVETVRKGIGMFTGDRAAREAGYHEESMASRAQFAAEFQVKNRTWFDSLIDGFNRLPRPAIVAMVIYYFVMAYKNPTEFQVLNVALDTIPEFMWQIALIVVTFYFVAREVQKSRDKRLALSKADFDEAQRRVKELRATQAPMPEEAYAAEMADTSQALSNPAILEWNRRRQQSED